MTKAAKFLKYFLILVIVLSFSIIAGFFIRRAYDRYRQVKLMGEFESEYGSTEELDHHYTGLTNMDNPYPEMDYIKGDTIAILTLERLGIKVAITEGTDKDTLHVSAGHFEESDMPGEGNFCIAGHSSFIYTCLFNDMHKAEIGDEINVYTKNGKHTYIVSEIETVEPDDIELLDHENESIITIVTCNNNGAQRLIIRGIEVEQ